LFIANDIHSRLNSALSPVFDSYWNFESVIQLNGPARNVGRGRTVLARPELFTPQKYSEVHKEVIKA
jgi:hypothetical protein